MLVSGRVIIFFGHDALDLLSLLLGGGETNVIKNCHSSLGQVSQSPHREEYLDATRRHANHGVKWTFERLEMFKLWFPSKIFDATSARNFAGPASNLAMYSSKQEIS